MDVVLKALADPIRRRILYLLGGTPLPAGRIAGNFPVSRPAISRHLRVLRSAGLVHSRDTGRERLYQLEPARLVEAERFLAELSLAARSARAAWERRFMALDTEVHRVRAQHRAARLRPDKQTRRKSA